MEQKTPDDGQPSAQSARDRFLASMKMTFDMWHDGTGYDLDALRQIPKQELRSVEQMLIERSPRDWRDIEALAQIDSDEARAVVEAGLKSSDEHVRNTARQYVPQQESPADRERLLLESLRKDDLFGGLSQAIDEAAEFHPPAVVEALVRGVLNRDGQVAIHFVALLYFIHGKADEPFDWNHRPYFLKFLTNVRVERIELFRDLCHQLGIDSSKYVR